MNHHSTIAKNVDYIGFNTNPPKKAFNNCTRIIEDTILGFKVVRKNWRFGRWLECANTHGNTMSFSTKKRAEEFKREITIRHYR